MKLGKRVTRKRRTDLKPFRYNRRGNHFVLRYFLQQLIIRWLVEQNHVVKLVPDFAFGPLLLFRFSATSTLLGLHRFLLWWFLLRGLRGSFRRLHGTKQHRKGLTMSSVEPLTALACQVVHSNKTCANFNALQISSLYFKSGHMQPMTRFLGVPLVDGLLKSTPTVFAKTSGFAQHP